MESVKLQDFIADLNEAWPAFHARVTARALLLVRLWETERKPGPLIDGYDPYNSADHWHWFRERFSMRPR